MSLSILRSFLPTPARLAVLTELRTQIFGTTHNPLSLRTGSKVLKARLRGPSMMRYYGERMSGVAAMNNAVPGLDLVDVAEQTRLIDLEARRKRGKVTPKKGFGRRAAMKKR